MFASLFGFPWGYEVGAPATPAGPGKLSKNSNSFSGNRLGCGSKRSTVRCKSSRRLVLIETLDAL